MIQEFLAGVINKSLNNKNEGDITDKEGYLVCGKCGERKQKDIKMGDKTVRVGVLCKCGRDEIEKEKQAEQRERFEHRMEMRRVDSMADPWRKNNCFKNDDKRHADITRFCKRYVDEWQTMYDQNIGVLFYGDIGTGKTFYSDCIINALYEKLVPVCSTGIPRIMNKLFDDKNKQKAIDDLVSYACLAIDDFGVERNTSYATEQIYMIINERSEANKPTIITTNLTLEEMKQAADTQTKRIYDRILGMCPARVCVDGTSRRNEQAQTRKNIVAEMFKNGGT